jgi:hypothetical protein
MNMSSSRLSPAISGPAWRSLRALAGGKYAGHTPAIPIEHAHELSKHGFAIRVAGVMAVTDQGEQALAQWNHFIAGRYRTQRDQGVEYAYEAEWQQTTRALLWNATVRRNGDYAGTPSGQFLGEPTDVPSTVRDFVENAIEKRAGVD